MSNQTTNQITQDILIVDDTLANLKVLSDTLTSHGYKVRGVKSGKLALDAAKAVPPNLILLDINMPEMDGYEVCHQLKSHDRTRHVPIIFLTASNNVKDKVKAFNIGGVDYIPKPFQVEEVLARVQNQLDIQSAQAQVRQLNAELEQKVQERTKFLNQKLRELEETKRILHNTFYDSLTDLPNRISLTKYLEQAILRSKKEANYSFAILLLDCSWQDLSQSESSLTEHKLIRAIAKRVLSSIRQADTLARISKNQFVALLPEVARTDDAIQMARQIHQQFATPLTITRQKIAVDISIGIVWGSKKYQQSAHLLRDAKSAKNQAKQQGKNQHCLFAKTTTPYR